MEVFEALLSRPWLLRGRRVGRCAHDRGARAPDEGSGDVPAVNSASRATMVRVTELVGPSAAISGNRRSGSRTCTKAESIRNLASVLDLASRRRPAESLAGKLVTPDFPAKQRASDPFQGWSCRTSFRIIN